ncbi:hypothetical protein BZG36_04545 [Bifiguratus adelaidae]|uniref:Peptidase M48 domain-containing protein n=1 Tax=Bifiguratus adelaidae TaxID=1938954 RepID=A0A261XV76_9FUNG|nr:hypothetical protein BZG36_04545 [Bifiguratus adelaidae]
MFASRALGGVRHRVLVTPVRQFQNVRRPPPGYELQRFPPKTYGPNKEQYQRFEQNRHGHDLRKRRRLIFIGTGTAIFGGYYVTHLETVPVSGRRRFIDITPKQEEALAKLSYQEVMQQFGSAILPSWHPYTRFVKKVAERIIRVSGMESLNWEFYVIKSDEKNAFVLPGGKVFVFTGILPVVGNEGRSHGMAAVLGHEIAHQLARHSAEKLSFAKIIFVGQLLISTVIDPSVLFNRLFYNLGIMMPFSRKCETEADFIGLQLMAQACYDPREAIKMWTRMEQLSHNAVKGDAQSPQFLSTHPSHKNRVAALTKELPDALSKRAASDCAKTDLWANMFANATRWVKW